MIRLLSRKLRTDKRGAAVIELALTAPILGALVIGISDMTRAYSLKLLLEQSAQRAIEQVEQQKSVASSYTSTVTSEATSAMTDAGYSTGNSYSADAWLECGSGGTWTRQTDFNGNCPNSTDTTSRYVKITISRAFVPFFPSRAWPGANAQGNIPVSGSAEVRVQ
ncbi:MAG: TadE/TadG family type IV pilus assembly protein [Sphingomonas sp.]